MSDSTPENKASNSEINLLDSNQIGANMVNSYWYLNNLLSGYQNMPAYLQVMSLAMIQGFMEKYWACDLLRPQSYSLDMEILAKQSMLQNIQQSLNFTSGLLQTAWDLEQTRVNNSTTSKGVIFGDQAENNKAEKERSEACSNLDIKRDMVNYEALKGHRYEIKPNPDRKNCKNTRIYVCKYDNCNKEFSKTWNLVYHFRVHTREKPYKWNQCDKSFTQNSNLKKHLATHQSETGNKRKIHECDIWKKKYSSVYYLNTHKRSSH